MRRLIAAFMVAVVALTACTYPKATTDTTQKQQQERIQAEASAQVGMPALKNFRERKLLKDLYELRDQTGLLTYTYLWSDVQGKTIFLCDSIGYAVPYAAQFTNPEKVDEYWYGGSRYVETIPQAEPNGLFSPNSAEGTWVLCKGTGSDDVRPVYVEPRIIVSQFRLEP